jgi:outer membrane protein TolC
LLAAVDVGLKENPVIEAAMHSERAGASAVDVAFADLLPRVDLQGRVSGSHETNLDDVSSESGTLLARVTIPLYQSGVEHSRVREAKERRNQFRIQVEQARRQVVEQVTQAWEVLTSTRSNIEARRQAVNANEIALDGVREEASVGSRTTLDVLDAEQELLDSRVALVDAERDEYVAGFTLLSALGRLSVERLGVPVEVYDPLPHYEKVRRAFWGWQTID